MKNLFCILFCVMLLLVCCACAMDGNTTQPKREFEFQAIVKEVMEDSILVMPEDSYDEAGVAMGIGVVVAKSDLIPIVQVGDRVRICYDGVMTRSIPPVLGQVYSFEVIE